MYKSLAKARSGVTNVEPDRAIYIRALLKPGMADCDTGPKRVICIRALPEPAVAIIRLMRKMSVDDA